MLMDVSTDSGMAVSMLGQKGEFGEKVRGQVIWGLEGQSMGPGSALTFH